MDLKRVSRISQKYKDIVNGFAKEVECLFPDNNSYFNIVDLIKHLILLYYHTTFESKLLNDEEKDKLLNLLKQNNKSIADYSWKLVFESREDGKKTDIFIKKVYNRPNIILLIKLQGQTIIGGFTKTGWNKSIKRYKWSADKNAFVFFLQSKDGHESFISNVKQNEEAVDHALGYYGNQYGMFGYCWIFYVTNESLYQQWHHGDERYGNYEPFKHGQRYLGQSSGRSYNCDQWDIEAFQIQYQ